MTSALAMIAFLAAPIPPLVLAPPKASVKEVPRAASCRAPVAWMALFGSLAAAQALGARDETSQTPPKLHLSQESAASRTDGSPALRW
jgi:hypothetical protein